MTRSAPRRYSIGPLVAFYRHLQFGLPRITAAARGVLLVGVAAIQLRWLTRPEEPPMPGYVAVFRVVAAAAVGLAVAAALGRPPRLPAAGWSLGSRGGRGHDDRLRRWSDGGDASGVALLLGQRRGAGEPVQAAQLSLDQLEVMAHPTGA